MSTDRAAVIGSVRSCRLNTRWYKPVTTRHAHTAAIAMPAASFTLPHAVLDSTARSLAVLTSCSSEKSDLHTCSMA